MGLKRKKHIDTSSGLPSPNPYTVVCRGTLRDLDRERLKPEVYESVHWVHGGTTTRFWAILATLNLLAMSVPIFLIHHAVSLEQHLLATFVFLCFLLLVPGADAIAILVADARSTSRRRSDELMSSSSSIIRISSHGFHF